MIGFIGSSRPAALTGKALRARGLILRKWISYGFTSRRRRRRHITSLSSAAQLGWRSGPELSVQAHAAFAAKPSRRWINVIAERPAARWPGALAMLAAGAAGGRAAWHRPVRRRPADGGLRALCGAALSLAACDGGGGILLAPNTGGSSSPASSAPGPPHRRRLVERKCCGGAEGCLPATPDAGFIAPCGGSSRHHRGGERPAVEACEAAGLRVMP